jgi:hypothetical protein
VTLLRRALNDARTAQAFQLLNPERNMKTYTGTKTLRAKPMTRDDYNTLRGWATPPEENGADEGYLVEYLDGGKANHPDFENYISWSPKDVFERTYREQAESKLDPETAAGIHAWVKAHAPHRREVELVVLRSYPVAVGTMTREHGEDVKEFIDGVMLGRDPMRGTKHATGPAEARLAGQ